MFIEGRYNPEHLMKFRYYGLCENMDDGTVWTYYTDSLSEVTKFQKINLFKFHLMTYKKNPEIKHYWDVIR